MSFRSRNSGRALLPFGLDYSDVLANNHETEKPQLVLPVHGSLNEYEILSSKQSIAFTQLMVDGPFYTGNVDINGDKKSPSQSNTAPDGIARYSDRYKKVKKIGRSIEEHPYQLEFFPEELYSVMGISNKQKKKLLSLSSFKSNGGLKEYSIDENSESDKAASMLERLKDMAEELDEEQDKDDDGEDLEEELDDEFDEDEDDDYNAEKYFDDGEDDGGNDAGNDEAAF
ncbi:DNA-directed RNA polymerase III subunit, HMG-like protein [Scheffersomyces coipomensis]|uniref:DNA-directed RNA polymerase III subunit, HMG-like protein n=1 Tax=Scheffersomyces coipomensis TaxID=1788519 RepID=UPI00315DBFF3